MLSHLLLELPAYQCWDCMVRSWCLMAASSACKCHDNGFWMGSGGVGRTKRKSITRIAQTEQPMSGSVAEPVDTQRFLSTWVVNKPWNYQPKLDDKLKRRWGGRGRLCARFVFILWHGQHVLMHMLSWAVAVPPSHCSGEKLLIQIENAWGAQGAARLSTWPAARVCVAEKKANAHTDPRHRTCDKQPRYPGSAVAVVWVLQLAFKWVARWVGWFTSFQRTAGQTQRRLLSVLSVSFVVSKGI